MELNVNTRNKAFIIYLIDRLLEYVSSDFINEYSPFLLESESQNLLAIYAGNLSIWFDDSCNLETKKFASALNVFGLRNYVK